MGCDAFHGAGGEWGAPIPRVVGCFACSRHLWGAGDETLWVPFAKWEAGVDLQLLLCSRMRPFSAGTHLGMGWDQTFALLHIII